MAKRTKNKHHAKRRAKKAKLNRNHNKRNLRPLLQK